MSSCLPQFNFSVLIFVIAINLITCFQRNMLSNLRMDVSVKPDSSVAKPKWADGGFISDTVNSIISFKPFFGVMKVGARNALISTTEKKNVRWIDRANYLETKAETLQQFYNDIKDPNLEYPSYYLNAFHAYDTGNLEWLAAYECEQATLSIALRIWITEKLKPLEAQERLRTNVNIAIEEYLRSTTSNSNTLATSTPTPSNILDVGCSVGVSTFALADKYPSATVTGLDLSPYFLAVAKYRQLELQQQQYAQADVIASCDGIEMTSDISRVKWLHAVAEDTKLPSNSFDLITMTFMVHELPGEVTQRIVKELYRLLKPGGMVAITDINPRSSLIQNLPPVLFTLMKSTEPFLESYFDVDFETVLTSIGYSDIRNPQDSNFRGPNLTTSWALFQNSFYRRGVEISGVVGFGSWLGPWTLLRMVENFWVSGSGAPVEDIELE
eukprot:gene2607-5098_t